jgi:hypothetical protein
MTTGPEPSTKSIEQSLLELTRLLAKQTIGAGTLAGGGKLNPARGLPGGSGIHKPKKPKRTGRFITITKPRKAKRAEPAGERKRIFVPILKQNDEQQTVTGVVLQPEVVDAQGDIISADVIKDAAFKFLAGFNKTTKLGLQHKDFKKGRFALVESFITPMDLVIGNKTVKAGSWVMTVKVLDPKIWLAVKEGKITGFSIGGRARVKTLVAAGKAA